MLLLTYINNSIMYEGGISMHINLQINNKRVGTTIKSIRLEMGMTQEEFGNLFGATRSNVSKWERGSSLPNQERLKQIAKISNKSIDELLYGKGIAKLDTHKYLLGLFNDYLEIKNEFIENEINSLLETLIDVPSYNLGIKKVGQHVKNKNDRQKFMKNFKTYGKNYILAQYEIHNYEYFKSTHVDGSIMSFQKFKDKEWIKTKQVFDKIIDEYTQTFIKNNNEVWINERFTSKVDDELTEIRIKTFKSKETEHYLNDVQTILDEAAQKIRALNKNLDKQ